MPVSAVMFVFKLFFTVLAGGKVGCEKGGVFIKIRMYYFKIIKIYIANFFTFIAFYIKQYSKALDKFVQRLIIAGDNKLNITT